VCTRIDTKRCSRLIADWSVKGMNPDVTQYRVLLDVNVSSTKKCRRIADWSIKGMNPDVTQYRVLLDVNVYIFNEKM
jgi:hypothetical protein